MMTTTEDSSIEGRRAEIREKLGRVRRKLGEAGKEALLLSRHPNFSWITAGAKGFVANHVDDAVSSVLVTQNAAFVVCSNIEEPRLEEEEALNELGFEFLVYPWQENRLAAWVARMVSSIDKAVSDSDVAGLAADPAFTRALRFPFTANEEARYRYLGDNLSRGLEEFMLTVKPGMTEYEIAGGAAASVWKYGIEQVMHLASADERCVKYRHALPTGKKLEHNLIVSINGRYKGLVTTVSRQVYFGKPPAGFAEQYDACCDMETSLLELAVPGTDELAMYDALYKDYLARGYAGQFDKHNQGGCQGYWPREYMITPLCHFPLEAGKAYCWNPVVDSSLGGTKSEDAWYLADSGPEMLTRPVLFPKKSYSVRGKTVERPGLLIVD